MKKATEDLFIEAKLSFFGYVASLVEPYLKRYQTDSPMIPYMHKDLKSIVKRLLGIIVKAEAIDGKSAVQLMSIKLEYNLLALSEI